MKGSGFSTISPNRYGMDVAVDIDTEAWRHYTVIEAKRILDRLGLKPGGGIEYSEFATAIDPRIVTRCIACPPDAHPDEFWCAWEFVLKAEVS